MAKIFVQSMFGLGDQVYARPFIKKLAEDAVDRGDEVYCNPTLPRLLEDLPVTLIDPNVTTYRTQQKAYKQFDAYTPVDPDIKFDRTINYHYGRWEMKKHAVIPHIELAFGLNYRNLTIDLPPWLDEEQKLDDLALYSSMRIAVVRPPTLRVEWPHSTKTPRPDYINWCARILRDSGYYVVSIADCEAGEEWLEGDAPPADRTFHKGELGIYGTMALMRRASLVLGGPGFIIPSAIAADTNLFVIFGGRGAYDNPYNLFDMRMKMKKIGWAMPDNFCRCNKMVHDCDKYINNLDSHFMKFMGDIYEHR